MSVQGMERMKANRGESGGEEKVGRGCFVSPDVIHRRIPSDSIFGGDSCIVIEHGQQEYRLQITRMGKLILTK